MGASTTAMIHNPITTPYHSDCAELALALMHKHHITPAPENYAIWFHYAQGKNAELIREVDNIINNSLAFTEETSSYLRNKFILPSASQKAVDEAATVGHSVLVEVLKAINDFSNEADNYHKNVDDYLDNITQKFDDKNLKSIVRDLINATVNMKKSGEQISKRLEASTQEITVLKKDLQQVTIEAQRDFLTGVFNRKTFEHFVDEQITHARETGEALCLLMIDIDHFKRFNDRFGHLLGDEVLKTVARTLINVLKGRDVVARFGGEEFVVVLPETPLEGAMKVADSIRNAIASKELKRKDTGETFGSITVSIGAARFRPASDTLPLLIKRADDALYVSKKNGRNRVTSEA